MNNMINNRDGIWFLRNPNNRTFECSICKTKVTQMGNNPEPVAPINAGPCCDDCNENIVIERRLAVLQ